MCVGSSRAGCRAGGLISALSSAASQPPRDDGPLPKAGAVHAPRQVSGCPGGPPAGPVGGELGAAGPRGKRPSLGQRRAGVGQRSLARPFCSHPRIYVEVKVPSEGSGHRSALELTGPWGKRLPALVDSPDR